jgi:hypothetical protein
MSPSDFLDILTATVIVTSAAFIALRALRLRKALVDHSYRARALWTAIGALSIVGLFLAEYFTSVYGITPQDITGLLITDVFWGFTLLGLYGWVASNINVAISTDFFNRDALSWKKGGRIIATLVIWITFILFSVPSTWVPTTISTGTAGYVLTLLLFVVLFYSAGTLGLASHRIKDKLIKGYTRWVALSVLFLLIVVIVNYAGWNEVVALPAALWVFCMYRSVGSLAIRSRGLPS